MAKDDVPQWFMGIPHIPLAKRFVDELGYTIHEMLSRPLSYLSVALLPDPITASLPIRLAGEVGVAISMGFAHPIAFVKDALTPDEIGMKRRGKLGTILAVSGVFHGALIVYIIYAALLAPYANLHMVEQDYEKLNLAELRRPLYNPAQLRGPSTAGTRSLEEIRELDRKRKEERERRAREKKAKEEEEARKAEAARKAEEARLKAEAAKKEGDEKAKTSSTEFGAINVTPIKDIVGKVYEMYEAGTFDVGNDFVLMASFKIAPDGSIPKSSIKIMQSSKNQVVDDTALEVLWRLGESHALGPLSVLSSNTIKLEINEKLARLTITSFAPTADDASMKAKQLSALLTILRFAQRSKNPAVYELLSHLTLTANNKRIDADMSVSRSKATEMMKSQFSKALPSNPGEK